jgi:hypothetical protein
MIRIVSLVAACFGALALHSAPASAAPVPKDQPKVDLVLCLDVSNSMDGLIDSAKLKLWDVVNELAKMKPTPELRVGLYSYGHTDYSAKDGWVRKDLDLTTDLDEVYAKLTALKTRGGTEYVARVTRDALNQQKWADAKDSLKLIFVCGNEPADQDKEVSLSDVAKTAKEKGIHINTIYCGADSNPESTGWKDFAVQCNGKYSSIDQERARKTSVASTPFDKELNELSGKLNSTYVTYGADRAKKAENQQVQDKNAAAAAPGAGAARAASKAGDLYRNSSWDLIDKMKDDPKFDLKSVKEEDLCEELQKIKAEDRLPYLKKKAEERAEIQKKIGELAVKRAKHIEEEIKKAPKPAGEQALDEALRGTIREQAKAKGLEAPAEKK